MVLAERRAFTTPNFPGDPIVLTLEHDAETVPLRTGCRLWSSSYALVEYLSCHAHLVRDKSVIELGAGVGACGLACASLGAESVTITDRDDATLALAHANALRNGWFDGTRACEVSVRRLDWGDATTYDARADGYDLVIAADVVYLEEHARELASAVSAHVGASGKFVCAFGVRKPELAEAFAGELKRRGFDISAQTLDYVSDEMRATASEHAHDDEITAKGGYRLLEATRRDTDDELANFAKEFEEFGMGTDERVARALHDDEDEPTTSRVDFSDACAYVVDVSADEVAVGYPSASTIAHAAESLRVHGFFVLQPSNDASSSVPAMVPQDVLNECASTGEAHLNELLARVVERGLNPSVDIFRFAEICSRARGGKRYDHTRPESERAINLTKPKGALAVRAWESLQHYVAPWVEPVLIAAYGNEGTFAVKSVGCVSAEPGAPEQHFHADGRVFGIFNCFVPLAKVSRLEGPTEFIHGSHLWRHDAAYVTTPERKAQAAAPRVQPELMTPGSLLVYDYRVMHRGSANDSAKRRPLAYVMYGVDATKDNWNFPDESIWDGEA